MDDKTIARFWAKVRRRADDECWEWIGDVTNEGYGKFKVKKQSQSSHRLAWLICRGPITSGTCVLHACDNRLCVNPSHLFLGTNRQNTQDMVSKGRSRLTKKGSSPVKLTEEQVRELRSDRGRGMAMRQIAAKYGISGKHARRIVNFHQWKSVSQCTESQDLSSKERVE